MGKSSTEGRRLSSGQTIATSERNRSQHCWAQHVACVWWPSSNVVRHVASWNRSSAHDQATNCWTNLAKRPQYHATSITVAWKVWPFSNLSQQHPTCRNTSQQGGLMSSVLMLTFLLCTFYRHYISCIHYFLHIYGGITYACIPCITLHIWWHTVTPLHPSPLTFNKQVFYSKGLRTAVPFFVLVLQQSLWS